MRLSLSLVFLLTMILSLPNIGISGAVMQIYRVPEQTIVPDGILSDWPQELFNRFTPEKPECSWAIACDKNFLHLAVRVNDITPEYSDISSQTSLKNDSVHIYLHTAHTDSGFTITRWGKTQQTVIIPLTPGSLDPRWLEGRFQPQNDGYTCEVSISRRALFLNTNENSLSMQIVVLDLATGVIKNVYAINNRLTGWQNPAHFLQFIIP